MARGGVGSRSVAAAARLVREEKNQSIWVGRENHVACGGCVAEMRLWGHEAQNAYILEQLLRRGETLDPFLAA